FTETRLLNLEADALRGARLREVVGDDDLDLVLPGGELAERDRAREGDAREVCSRVGRELARGSRDDGAPLPQDLNLRREVYRASALRARGVVDEGQEVEARGAREAPVDAELNLRRAAGLRGFRASHDAAAQMNAAQGELVFGEVRDFYPLRGAARLPAARVARRDLHLVEARRERRRLVVDDAGPLARRGARRERRHVQARLEVPRRL